MNGPVHAYLLLSSVVCAAVGALSVAVAVRERRRGSAAWPLPAAFGVLLVVGCLVRLAVVAS